MPIDLLFDFQDEDGNKMINEYVRECKIGSGSYGKVVSVNSHLQYYQIFVVYPLKASRVLDSITLIFSITTGFIPEHCRWPALRYQGKLLFSLPHYLVKPFLFFV